MKHRNAGRAVLAFVVSALVLFNAACQPAAPSNINIVNNNTNTNTNGKSGTDPAETNKAKGSVKSETKKVTVNGFANGEKCPSGITPANNNKAIRNGCDLAVTCNPRRADDSVIQDDAAPPVDVFALVSGQDVVTFSQSASNSYNGDIHSLKPGKFALLCIVVGISSGLQEFEVIP